LSGRGAAHRPRKRFGQHFLHDEAVLERMVAALALRRDDRVLEIGPGEGALTAHLAPAVDRLVAIEIDRDLVAALHARFPAVEIVSADVLRADLGALLAGTDAWRVVGNLPYNISTPLLGRLLDVASRLRDMHFLLQKEVVDRLAAEPGTKAWGRLSVMAQWRLHVEPLFGIAPGSFRPPPKVQSTFLRLRPKPVDASVDAAVLARVVAMAFQQRRKRLSNALQSLAIDWSRAPVDPGLRADAVDLAGYAALARFLAGSIGRHEGMDE
jgi:16S rRNA (adenine1518-N6/adenine1519-N6)-dimethyltransferase